MVEGAILVEGDSARFAASKSFLHSPHHPLLLLGRQVGIVENVAAEIHLGDGVSICQKIPDVPPSNV